MNELQLSFSFIHPWLVFKRNEVPFWFLTHTFLPSLQLLRCSASFLSRRRSSLLRVLTFHLFLVMMFLSDWFTLRFHYWRSRAIHHILLFVDNVLSFLFQHHFSCPSMLDSWRHEHTFTLFLSSTFLFVIETLRFEWTLGLSFCFALSYLALSLLRVHDCLCPCSLIFRGHSFRPKQQKFSSERSAPLLLSVSHFLSILLPISTTVVPLMNFRHESVKGFAYFWENAEHWGHISYFGLCFPSAISLKHEENIGNASLWDRLIAGVITRCKPQVIFNNEVGLENRRQSKFDWLIITALLFWTRRWRLIDF